ncbi:glycosyltransferase family 4 protein [Methanoculleus sp. Wushi-C6]|uniref:Glycosyltransferase family 4 protein n=1 Tax=Methanoculleus caldifontis TaxID=2651577 RepID=A0ABU3X3I5_9EURY|nr:hypothetical protein [Methanoculleus sp. Wushi-C6]MDV2482608.1 glycosyltransferase family 4 protein [Methanoculleus sp. Wushi-C6]
MAVYDLHWLLLSNDLKCVLINTVLPVSSLFSMRGTDSLPPEWESYFSKYGDIVVGIMDRRRILIGLVEIAGYNANLKTGFQELGLDCTFINQKGHVFGYAGDDVPICLVAWQKSLWKRAQQGRTLLKYLWYAVFYALNLPVFVWAIIRFDVFILGYNSTFLGYLDLPLLRLLGKRVIYIFFGSDGRPPYIDGALCKSADIDDPRRCMRMTRMQKRKIRWIERFADVTVHHPAAAHLQARQFVKGLNIGIPFARASVEENDSRMRNGIVRILHSPSDPDAKGTPAIRDAIRSLQAKGYPIEYFEITGKPHAVVLDELQRCDIVVDQLYSDTPMAVFATEAAWYGKPAVVGGYYARYIWDDYAADVIPPAIYCYPAEIEDALEPLVTDAGYRAEVGRRARDFVQTQWNPVRVAERYLRLIDGDVPEHWVADPRAITYLQGAGMAEERVSALVRAIVDKGGVQALCLSDKPDLERLFVSFACAKFTEESVLRDKPLGM